MVYVFLDACPDETMQDKNESFQALVSIMGLEVSKIGEVYMDVKYVKSSVIHEIRGMLHDIARISLSTTEVLHGWMMRLPFCGLATMSAYHSSAC